MMPYEREAKPPFYVLDISSGGIVQGNPVSFHVFFHIVGSTLSFNAVGHAIANKTWIPPLCCKI